MLPSFDICHSKSHLALKLIRNFFAQLDNCLPATQVALPPSGLPALICHQATLTNLLGRKESIAREDD
jgi:hypothetical protein